MVLKIPGKTDSPFGQKDVRETIGIEGQMTGSLDMNSNKIKEVANPTNAQDAANKQWCETVQIASVITSLGSQAENLVMNSNKITGLTDGAAAQDAAAFGQIPAVSGATQYWSCPGCALVSDNIGVSHTYDITNGTSQITAAMNAGVEVVLPHGAVVTSAKANADAATADWSLRRVALDGATDIQMAGAACNTADATITSATIDNSQYVYLLRIQTSAGGEEIFNLLITYTLP